MILEDPSVAALPHRGGDQPRNHPHHGVHQICIDDAHVDATAEEEGVADLEVRHANSLRALFVLSRRASPHILLLPDRRWSSTEWQLATSIPLFPIPLEWGMGYTFPTFPACGAGDDYMVGAGGLGGV